MKLSRTYTESNRNLFHIPFHFFTLETLAVSQDTRVAVPQPHGGTLIPGGKPGNRGADTGRILVGDTAYAVDTLRMSISVSGKRACR